jgi:hypothetical protein
LARLVSGTRPSEWEVAEMNGLVVIQGNTFMYLQPVDAYRAIAEYFPGDANSRPLAIRSSFPDATTCYW